MKRPADERAGVGGGRRPLTVDVQAVIGVRSDTSTAGTRSAFGVRITAPANSVPATAMPAPTNAAGNRRSACRVAELVSALRARGLADELRNSTDLDFRHTHDRWSRVVGSDGERRGHSATRRRPSR